MSPIRLRVRELREAKGWTQAQLAEAAGIARVPTISDYESGRIQRPDLETLDRIAKALGVDPGFLLVREDAPRHRKGQRTT